MPPNTTERGAPAGITPSYNPKNGRTRFQVDPLEFNPELQFPNSIPIYDAMRSQDSHVGGALSAIILPIMGANWELDGGGTGPDDVRPEVMRLVRTELGLTGEGQGRGRRRREGISWRKHLQDVIGTHLWAGFAAFEQVYQVSPPRRGQENLGLDEIVHLRKLSPRLPRTITSINVARDGGLESIGQTNPDLFAWEDIEIPVSQLVFYVHNMEGADWSGRSILRQAYKFWLMKDVFLRLDAQAAERNSMGIPRLSITDESQRAEAEEIGATMRAGANAFVVASAGIGVDLMGVSGSTMDLTGKLNYLDQEISRSLLAMFMDLGHDNGARSLGDTFYNDVFMPAVQKIADDIAETATEHIVRDLVEHNFGPDEPYPVLTPGDLKTNRTVQPAVLNQLVTAGIIKPDGQLEDHVRKEHGLPEAARDETNETMPADEQLQRGYFAQGLIRTGFTPEAALRAAGLDPIEHLGLIPSTLQAPAEAAAPPAGEGPDLSDDPNDPERPTSLLVPNDDALSRAVQLNARLVELAEMRNGRDHGKR